MLRTFFAFACIQVVSMDLSLRAQRSNLYSRPWREDIRDCHVTSLLAMTSWGLS